MPVAVSYPGVYIQEVPSGVHTITGVSTSIGAFFGRTAKVPSIRPCAVSACGLLARIRRPPSVQRFGDECPPVFRQWRHRLLRRAIGQGSGFANVILKNLANTQRVLTATAKAAAPGLTT